MKHVHRGYGFFPGGDPRRFTPDQENPQEALDAHKAACARWDEAEKAGQSRTPEAGSCVHVAPGVLVTPVGYGLGGYEHDCEDPGCDEAQPPEEQARRRGERQAAWDDEYGPEELPF